MGREERGWGESRNGLGVGSSKHDPMAITWNFAVFRKVFKGLSRFFMFSEVLIPTENDPAG